MKRFSALLVSILAVSLLALPAAAQQDPYGEVLPDGGQLPGDVTAPPDTAAPGAVQAPARGDQAEGVQNNRAEGVQSAGQPPQPVSVLGRQLPATGGELTIGLLILGTGLLAAGGGIVLQARRRESAGA